MYLSCLLATVFMQPGAPALTLTERDNSQKFDVMQWRIIEVKLLASPGAGYAWYPVKNDLLATTSKTRFRPIDHRSGKVGADEHQLFFFRAEKAGETKLEFQYGRAADIRDKMPDKVLAFRIKVKPGSDGPKTTTPKDKP